MKNNWKIEIKPAKGGQVTVRTVADADDKKTEWLSRYIERMLAKLPQTA